ncbi:MAG: glycosyltransferase family 4 protein [Cyclobacteriaceae bacterium]|nr:glycosyltransferase family 4 protein [Cyclobacteriaceae bacterium]UYN87379.1 MAG: glycosyltransferase family 4 protein [Cyclobacteriaceae bacterium]
MHSFKKITFIAPYSDNIAPSQRFRFEQYFDALKEKGFRFTYFGFIPNKKNRGLYTHKDSLSTLLIICIGFFRRIIQLYSISQSDFVFIHRECAPIAPPFFEWIIKNIFQKKIIYDFDDAIWLSDKIDESIFEKFIRQRNKVKTICKWSYKVSCGNIFLASYARQFNTNVIVNPTTIDTENLHNRSPYPNKKKSNQIIIGWTGSHSTLKYLFEVEEVLYELEKTFPQVTFALIADKQLEMKLERYDFMKWSRETEAYDLSKIDIGIMPLPDDEWSKGKCGFKALQYMAMSIPCVASPIGVNTTIIDHGINGFLASKKEEWLFYLTQLITNEHMRLTFGLEGRKKVETCYSVRSNTDNFLKLFT